MSGPIFVRVVAAHFVAGFEVANGKVTTTAPILGWLKGKTVDEARDAIRRKGWRASIIDPQRHVEQL